jgi:choline dehydrogenase-like flavoprotein
LEERLAQPAESSPRFFDDHAYETLRAVCVRLFPKCLAYKINLAGCIDSRLFEGTSDGWRYDAMPSDGEAYRRGLQGLDQSAHYLFQRDFAALSADRQDAVLRAVQSGAPSGEVWQTLPASRFFEELLAEAASFYYSHPLAQEEIGYGGMADGFGWQRIGLNEREDWEPRRDEPANGPAAPPPLPASAPAARIGEREPPAQTGEIRSRPGRCNSAEPGPVDVVVIGTGAGGAPIAARLAQARLSVALLEAGRHWNPAAFPTDEKAQSKLFWNDERLSAGADPVSFGSNNSGIGVGGSTLHFTAYTPRPHPDDFRIYSAFGVGADWPLTYEDLQPYFDEVEQLIGVSGPTPYPWGPRRRRGYPLPPLPLNGAAQLMARGCARLGIQTSPAPNAALSGPHWQPGIGWRRACANRGFCQAGCSIGAKASTDVTFIPLALQAGADLRSECFVTRIETDKAGRVSGIVYVQAGIERRQRCRTLFLCAGAIESPRLLLLSGLANGSGQVGRSFLAHSALQIWGRFDDEVRPYKGIPGGLISEDMHRPPNADFAGGYLLQSIGVMPVTYAGQLARAVGLWGQALDERMRGYNHTAGINICGECLPSETNYLELSDERDARGLPKPRIHFTNGENERRLTAHAERLMRAIWEEAGATSVWIFPRNAHTLGTCRMGSDPTSSVVDADGRCHEVPNLYIMDNSVYPSSLSVNPSLTQMALSLRSADRFLARMRHGDFP